MDSRDVADAVLAGAGLASSGELCAAGVHRNWIRRQVRAGRLQEPLPGVVALDGLDWTLPNRIAAALLFAGLDAAVDHRTAAHLWELAPEPATDEPIRVAIPHGRWAKVHRSVVVRQRQREPALQLGGFPVVPPAEALIAMAADTEPDRVRLAALEAHRRELLVPENLLRAPTTSLPLLRQIVAEARAGAISGGEAKYWRLLKQAGLPLPELNARLLTARGPFWVDALWRELRLGVEVDGRSVHTQTDAFEADRQRQNAIHLVAVVLLRFTVAQVLGDGPSVVAETRSALRARTLELGLPLSKSLR